MSSVDIESLPVEDSEIPEQDIVEAATDSVNWSASAINATSNVLKRLYEDVVVVADSAMDEDREAQAKELVNDDSRCLIPET